MSNKKKKLCIVLPNHWSDLMGGSEYQIKCLMELEQLHNLFDIYLLTSRIYENLKTDGYHIRSIVRSYSNHRFPFIFNAPLLLKRLKDIAPSVIYTNIGTSYAGISAFYCRRTGCKMVQHISSDANVLPYHGNKNIKSLFPFVEKKLLEYGIINSHKLIAQTNLQKYLIKLHFGREADAVIYNFQPLPSETINKCKPLKIVWIANFKPLKQPEIFIQLAKDLCKISADSEFIMAGRPSSDSFWQNCLERQIINTPKLTYLGEKTVDEINNILAGSHILVNTSRYEGFSNTFIQAWMRAMPVVSLHSNPDGLLNGSKMGFSSGCYEQLFKDVSLLIKRDKFRDKMGLDAQAFAFKYFTMKNANDVIQVLMD